MNRLFYNDFFDSFAFWPFETFAAEGLLNKQIAAQLGISANTVNNHVANIFSKTKVRSRIDLLNLLKQSW